MGLSSIHHPYSLKNIMQRLPAEEYPEYTDKLAKATKILNGFIQLEFDDQVLLIESRLGTTVENFKSKYKLYSEPLESDKGSD